MKLTYWVAECLNDANCYSIRTKTKRVCLRLVTESRKGSRGCSPEYAPPRRVTIEYADAFDLMRECSMEGAFWWEVVIPEGEVAELRNSPVISA